jgi:2-polyprenyl-6-methoxyphenol hydroxylase-like FAD-dependent oxidoreductase
VACNRGQCRDWGLLWISSISVPVSERGPAWGQALAFAGPTVVGWDEAISATRSGSRFGDPLVVTSRAELIDLLVSRPPDSVLRTGAVVRRVVPGGPAAPAQVDLADGWHEADLVVAADGIDSSVRSRLFPAHPGASTPATPYGD